MYQAILQNLGSIPSAVKPELINIEPGNCANIEFPSTPKAGQGFFLYNIQIAGQFSPNLRTGATYTSEVQTVWSPSAPGDSQKIHGIKTPADLSSRDIVFSTENTVYVLRDIKEKEDGKEVQ